MNNTINISTIKIKNKIKKNKNNKMYYRKDISICIHRSQVSKVPPCVFTTPIFYQKNKSARTYFTCVFYYFLSTWIYATDVSMFKRDGEKRYFMLFLYFFDSDCLRRKGWSKEYEVLGENIHRRGRKRSTYR